MPQKKFTLVADITTTNQEAVEKVLLKLVGVNALMITEGGFKVKTKMEGESARELNRSLLSALRRVEKQTTLRAEWTFDGTTERFFDYVAKGIRKS
jgi:hypothetical protein